MKLYVDPNKSIQTTILENIAEKTRTLIKVYLLLYLFSVLNFVLAIFLLVSGANIICLGITLSAGLILFIAQRVVRKKAINLLAVQESIKDGNIDVTLMEVGEDGKVLKTVNGDNAKEMFGRIYAKSEDKIEYTADEKFKVVVSNVIPTAIASIEESLERNKIHLVNKSSSALNKTITLLFSELNEAKAARNVLDAAGYSVGHAEAVG